MSVEYRKLIIDTLTKVVMELSEAIETNNATSFTETIEHHGKYYSRQMNREEFLQQAIEKAIQEIEDINCGEIEEV